MSETDMNNIMNQINQMLQNNEIPDNLKNIVNNLKNSSNESTETNNSSGTNNSSPDMDINTI